MREPRRTKASETRAGRVLYVEIDPTLRRFLAEETTQLHEAMRTEVASQSDVCLTHIAHNLTYNLAAVSTPY